MLINPIMANSLFAVFVFQFLYCKTFHGWIISKDVVFKDDK